MSWGELTALACVAVLSLISAAAYRVRSTDPTQAHLWFGLTRQENGRLGTAVGVVGLVVVGLLDIGCFAGHPLVTIIWGVLLVLCIYRGWIRKGSPQRRDG